MSAEHEPLLDGPSDNKENKADVRLESNMSLIFLSLIYIELTRGKA